jgi:hypothetical protein
MPTDDDLEQEDFDPEPGGTPADAPVLYDDQDGDGPRRPPSDDNGKGSE